jgi:predicted nucleic acid-binding protein
MGAKHVITIEGLDGRQGVVLDTMVFIYLFEDHTDYADRCERILDRINEGLFSGVVTPITAAEILVKPIQKGEPFVADRYRTALQSFPNLELAEYDMNLGFMAGSLRAQYGLPLPDMFQAATALTYPARTLITNDKTFNRINEIDVFLLNEISQ